MKKKIVILFSFAALFACCTPTMFKPTQLDVDVANKKWNGTTPEHLQKGYSLYIGKCGGCHYLHKPTEYTEEQWMKIMPEMSKEARLSDEEYDLIVRYVITKSQTMVKPG